MKKIMIAVLCILIGVAGGLAIVACDKSAETDAQLKEIDKFIETHEKNDAEIIETSEKTQFETVSELFLTDEVEEKKNADNYINTFGKSDIESNNGDYIIDAGGVEEVEELSTDFASTSQVITPEEFQIAGIIDWNGWRYTYYSEQVLPGEGLNIPDRWSDGQFVRDGNGYLCVASNEHEYGSIVPTPFGDAIVYDTIGDGVTGIIDIYVSW